MHWNQTCRNHKYVSSTSYTINISCKVFDYILRVYEIHLSLHCISKSINRVWYHDPMVHMDLTPKSQPCFNHWLTPYNILFISISLSMLAIYIGISFNRSSQNMCKSIEVYTFVFNPRNGFLFSHYIVNDTFNNYIIKFQWLLNLPKPNIYKYGKIIGCMYNKIKNQI